MFGDCGLGLPYFGRHRSLRDGSSDADREPVLPVSGIGGSILNSKQKKNGSLLRVWVRILFSNYEFKNCIWSIYNPDTGYTETLNPDIDIVVPEDDYGLYAIDILDPAWLVECPSVYEMLPNPGFNWKEQPLIQLTYKGKSVALPFNLSILNWAAGTRQMLDNAQLPDSVDFYNIYGISYDTPHNVCDDVCEISQEKKIPKSLKKYCFTHGQQYCILCPFYTLKDGSICSMVQFKT